MVMVKKTGFAKIITIIITTSVIVTMVLVKKTGFAKIIIIIITTSVIVMIKEN